MRTQVLVWMVFLGIFAGSNAHADFFWGLSDPGPVEYNPLVGEASFLVTLSLEEDTGGQDPGETRGFSASITYDPDVVTALSALATADLDDVNDGSGPDYLGVSTENVGPELGDPTGVTIACVFDLQLVNNLFFDVAMDLIDISFDTVPSALIDDLAGTTTSLTFEAAGDPAVVNLVVVGTTDATVTGDALDINLEPRFPYTYRARFPGTSAGYDDATGEGTLSLTLSIEETSGDAFETSGFQMSLAHDDALLTATAAVPVADLNDVNAGDGPAFFGVTLDASSVDSTGVTIECTYDLDALETIVFDTEKDVAVVTYDTVATALDGDTDGETTDFEFKPLGDPEIQNIVFTDDGDFLAVSDLTSVDLKPFESELTAVAENNIALLSVALTSGTGLLGTSSPISGFTFSFTFPTELVSVTEVVNSILLNSVNNGNGPDLVEVSVQSNLQGQTGLTIEVVFSDTDPDETIDVDSVPEEVLGVKFECLDEDLDTETITLGPAILGDPPVENALLGGDGPLLTKFTETTIDIGCEAGNDFMRGDSDGNGQVFALLDALHILSFGFVGGEDPPCKDAADADDMGGLFALLDALYLLQWGFVGGDPPPDPGTDGCGPDPTDDDGVDCLESTCTP